MAYTRPGRRSAFLFHAWLDGKCASGHGAQDHGASPVPASNIFRSAPSKSYANEGPTVLYTEVHPSTSARRSQRVKPEASPILQLVLSLPGHAFSCARREVRGHGSLRPFKLFSCVVRTFSNEKRGANCFRWLGLHCACVRAAGMINCDFSGPTENTVMKWVPPRSPIRKYETPFTCSPSQVSPSTCLSNDFPSNWRRKSENF